NKQLMIKNKLIQNASSGTYHYLPSMTRSMNKLVQIIDKEMKNIGAQKIIMPCLAPKRLWEKTDRWKTMGSELFKVVDRNGAEHCLSPTHEEAVTSIVASDSPISYKRLPIKLYQIGKKFRDEMRPKHGLLRGREFDMKDLYTFDCTLEDAQRTFDEVCSAYSNIFTWLDVPFVTVEASTGAMGGTKSSEFHLLSEVGEDILYRCDSKDDGGNKTVNNNVRCTQNGCPGVMHKRAGIELAHAFVLDTKYSNAFKAKFIDASGNKRCLVMGCYGIGVSRLLASTIEMNSTKDKLRYCSLLAPYQICIIPQKEGYKSDVTWGMSESLYDRLTDTTNLHDEVVIDDRLHMSIGQRLNQAVASGYPYIVALGKKVAIFPTTLE
ncbi:hypothetical protein HELRODRAFT_76349, partial [Helobdella robusta]|uniref:Probable proline--tRNA ligase, mitochondrial n=1 Tax=Helobdella robusta TaxID=6412 RepID=T1G2I7_HELRO